MSKSMTGYGKASGEVAGKRIGVEIRSVNSKQLDLSIKLPSLYRPVEYDIRARVARDVVRGKCDVYINVETTAGGATGINRAYFESYADQLNDLTGAKLDNTLVAAILRLPDVVSSDSDGISDEEQAALMSAVDRALEQFNAFRTQEGRVIVGDILGRIGTIETLLGEVAPYEKRRVELVRTKLSDAIATLKVEADSNRLEQEMIFYLEKLDITEEKVRLANHCKYFRQVADTEADAGRKLGFIAQEMGREINTLGSKANDSDIQRIVVQMKDELEKIKEQLLNVL